jgi:hypothetical protein
MQDAARIGILIAEQLRQFHEVGQTHGAVSPSTIAIAGNAVQLMPPAFSGQTITPNTAPELLQGAPADFRSDIFSFGTVVYEMLTGYPAFDGSSPEDLTAAILLGTPLPTGSPAADELLNGCLAKSPDDRFQNLQKVMLELKLLTSNGRRPAQAAAAPPQFAAPAPYPSYAAPSPFAPPPQYSAPQYAPPHYAPPQYAPPQQPAYQWAAPAAPPANNQLYEMESRMAARMQEQERSVAGFAQVANELLRAIREQQTGGVQSSAAPSSRSLPRSAFAASPLDDSPPARMERAIDLLSEKISRLDMVVNSAVDRLQKLEENLDAFDTDAAALRDSVTRDIRNFERSLKAHSTAIESARTAMGQTDDLVERVVEAIDSLQSMFAHSSEDRVLAS